VAAELLKNVKEPRMIGKISLAAYFAEVARTAHLHWAK
jgi:hypothetical protein